jgi:hypothetical protein
MRGQTTCSRRLLDAISAEILAEEDPPGLCMIDGYHDIRRAYFRLAWQSGLQDIGQHLYGATFISNVAAQLPIYIANFCQHDPVGISSSAN